MLLKKVLFWGDFAKYLFEYLIVFIFGFKKSLDSHNAEAGVKNRRESHSIPYILSKMWTVLRRSCFFYICYCAFVQIDGDT